MSDRRHARRRTPLTLEAAFAIAALVALAAPSASAEEEAFWRAAMTTGPGDNFAVAMRAADGYAERAASLHSPRRSARLARRAVEAYERAIEIDPARAEPHYRAAEVLYAHFIRDESPPDPEICERAITHWHRFEELQPLDSRRPHLLRRRALTHTKLADEEHFEQAARDYGALLELIDASSVDPQALATWISNKAEILMMLGELDESIELYARSLDIHDRALYGYGMAVALDRDGQGVKAREVIRAYSPRDSLRDLHRPGVFFVPEGEIHYYLGLGHDALGNAKKALDHFERYLDSGAHPQFHERAREHVRTLERKLQGESREDRRP